MVLPINPIVAYNIGLICKQSNMSQYKPIVTVIFNSNHTNTADTLIYVLIMTFEPKTPN